MNMEFIKARFLFLFLLISCSDRENNNDLIKNQETVRNIPMKKMVDIDLAENVVFKIITENAIPIGITAYAEDPDDIVTYQLTDNAQGRFAIDADTGIIIISNYTLFNTKEYNNYTLTVMAVSDDGSTQSKSFKVTVLIEDIYNNNLPIVNSTRSLFDWNEGEGQYLLGWDWMDDVAYGNPGWLLAYGSQLGEQEKYRWGPGPRSFNKSDYGKENTAIIDMLDRAPSTLIGGSLKIFEKKFSTDHRSTWWLWYDGKPLSERGITDTNTDRMSFYLKTQGVAPLVDDGGKESLRINFHIGTYLCWNTEDKAWGQGDGCPYEGVGNQHYYHTLAINSGAWIHVLLDQHPQKLRNRSYTLQNNPTKKTHNKNYFEQLSRFYFEIRDGQNDRTSFNVDELKYYSSLNMIEPEQNDESITSLWVGYWSEKDVWEIGFHDESYEKYNDNSNSTYEIRWSISPITNENFTQANAIWPEFYGGIEVAGVNSDNLIRRANGWGSHAWTRFKLPNHIEDNYRKVFFAVKDVSVIGEHVGKIWPYTKGDGHSSPSDNVKIIDYYLR